MVLGWKEHALTFAGNQSNSTGYATISVAPIAYTWNTPMWIDAYVQLNARIGDTSTTNADIADNFLRYTAVAWAWTAEADQSFLFEPWSTRSDPIWWGWELIMWDSWAEPHSTDSSWGMRWPQNGWGHRHVPVPPLRTPPTGFTDIVFAWESSEALLALEQRLVFYVYGDLHVDEESPAPQGIHRVGR